MFICKECGCEYKSKPDFCDCGNDTFVSTDDNIVTKEEPIITKKSIDGKELISRIIFTICIILSILVLIFFPKIDNKPTGKTDSKQTAISVPSNQNIPSLETFWINNKPEEKKEEPQISPVEQIKEIFIKPKPAKQEKTDVTSKQTKQTNNKKNPQKPAETNVKQSASAQQTTKQTTKQTTEKPKVQTSNTNQKSNMYEFINYKNRLRTALMNNLHFSQIQGSGTCGIEFAIDSSGKLINRAFTYQSDNKSVNDEIYKMLMRTSHFTPPPEAYKGEKIKMVFKLNNTSYSVDFVNP